MTKKNSINNSSKYKSITSTIIMKIIHHNNHNNYVNDSNSKNILDIAIISWLLLIFNQHVSSGLGKSVKFCGMYINTLCVYVCVFIHLLVSSGCMTSVIYVRSSDQRSFLVSIFWVLLPSSFISISESILFHLQRRKLQLRQLLWW